ncbi:MAG: DinB family protein [Gemmatimonadaceae bacterium]
MDSPTPSLDPSTPPALPTAGHERLTQIRRWYAYGRWAHAKMLTACETLGDDALGRDQGSSFGSVLGTLEHMYGADWVWLERWQGRIPASFPAKGTLRAIADFRAAWAALDAERKAYLLALTPARLDEPLAYRNLKGDAFALPLGDLLHHVSNHATYHRGQVMQFVRQLGGTAVSTDFLYWLPEEG